MNEDKIVAIIEVTDDNRSELLKLALSMYLGEKCKYCLGEFATFESLNDAVYAGHHEHGRLAHNSCWDANN